MATLTTASQSSPSPSPSPTSSSHLACRWVAPTPCTATFSDAEDLYAHITDSHIGRKQTNNLSLLCAWDTCALPAFTKRDHITSHVRIHVPLKPYVCAICGRAFKRPQDRKKHDKLHEEDAREDIPVKSEPFPVHVATPSPLSTDPSFFSELSYDPANDPACDPALDPSFLDAPDADLAFFTGFSDILAHDSMTPATTATINTMNLGGLDTFPALPHAESNPNSANDLLWSSSSSYDPDFANTASNGKRGYDLVDDFMMDFKKKKLSTTYDPELAQRLDEIATYLFDDPTDQQQSTASLAPLDDRPVEELNDLNAFLLQLSNEIDDSAYYLGDHQVNALPDPLSATPSYSSMFSPNGASVNGSDFLGNADLDTTPWYANLAPSPGNSTMSAPGAASSYAAPTATTAFSPHQMGAAAQYLPTPTQPMSLPPQQRQQQQQYPSAPAIHVQDMAPSLQSSSVISPYAQSNASSFAATPSPTTSPFDTSDVVSSPPFINLHMSNIDPGMFFPPAPTNDPAAAAPPVGSFLVQPQSNQQQQQRAPRQYEREREHVLDHYVNTLYTLTPQQSANPLLSATTPTPTGTAASQKPAQPTSLTSPRNAASATPRSASSRDLPLQPTPTPTPTATASAAPQPTSRGAPLLVHRKSASSTSHADATAATDALLKQFRNLSIENQIAKSALASPNGKAQQQQLLNHGNKSANANASALDKRKKHSMLVKALIHKITDKISKRDGLLASISAR
ncbi:hypothetical protein DFJ77DRAFT_511304 [Powellomyces hirtus]|nr:hypothetical protein DFJ77DRAFT_511304 [Powellomyces hirtus]